MLRGRTRSSVRLRAMTLVELILVMFLLASIMAFAAPSLSRFIGGRSLDEEARRLMGMTMYARSEAIARGSVMRVWIQPEGGLAGVSVDDPYDTAGFRPLQFKLAETAEYVIDDQSLEDGLGVIRYGPDGQVLDGSLSSVAILGRHGDVVALRREAESGTRYVLVDSEVFQ